MRTQTKEGKVSKLVKKELAEKLPEYKFRVKTFSYNDIIDVYWTRGPEMEEVEKILAKFRGDGPSKVNYLWLNRELN